MTNSEWPLPRAGRTAVELGNAANANLLPLAARDERGEGHSRKNGPPFPSPLLPRREEREKIELPDAASFPNSMTVRRRLPLRRPHPLAEIFSGLGLID